MGTPESGPVTVLTRIAGERKPVVIDVTKPVRPEWQRDVGTAWGTILPFTQRNLYRARAQLYYLPVLVAALLWRSPVGLYRIASALGRYLYDYDSAVVRHKHAGNTETPEYAKSLLVKGSGW
ncbi:MAG: hypothetical protein ACRDTH_08940 [Pseudonocardiaceae bacterium]